MLENGEVSKPPNHPPDKRAGTNELLKVHLAEYQNVFNVLIQLRDHQNKLTNYSLIVVSAVAAAALGLYKGAIPLEDVFWLLDLAALCLFTVLVWQQVYVDRTSFRLSDYIAHFLKPAIRDSLVQGLQVDEHLVEGAMRYDEYFFRRIGHPERSVLRGGRFLDFLFGATRYTIPTLGAVVAEIGLAVGCLSRWPVPGTSIWGTWGGILPWASLSLGVVALVTLMVAFILLTRDLRALWGSQKDPSGEETTSDAMCDTSLRESTD